MGGRSERDVCQVIRAAFLAPDLVEALLQGRRPVRLSVRGVMCPPTTLSGSSLFSYRSDITTQLAFTRKPDDRKNFADPDGLPLLD